MAGVVMERTEALFAVLVQVSPPSSKLKTKLEGYFQRKTSGGGECSVKAKSEEGVYLVFFKDKAAYERVISKKDHFLRFDSSTLKISVKPWNRESSEASEMNSLLQWQEDATERHLQEVYHQDSADTLSQKIFLQITAHLNTSLFSKDQRKQIKTRFPSLKIVKESVDLGIEEISGDFTEIDKVYQYLEKLRMGKREVSERGNSLNSRETENEINVDEVIYEYVTYVCQKEIEELQVKCNVCFKSYNSGDCRVVRVVALDGKNNVSKAHQQFISIYQKAAENLTQERVPLLASKSQISETVQSLKAKFPRVLAKEEENLLILRGPRSEIAQARTYLEKVNDRENWPVKPVRITCTNYTWENGIEIDSSQIFLLKTVLTKEIKEIEHKYDSLFVVNQNSISGKVSIQFEPKNKDSELYLCAYERFIGAFQRIMASLVQKRFNLHSEEDQKLKLFLDRLQKENQNVALQYSSGTLTMTGLPQHVSNAVAQVAHFLNQGVRGQATGIHSQATTTASDTEVPMEVEEMDGFTVISKRESEAATGEKKEITCPICLDKLEEKVVLSKCKHEFCKECIHKAMNQKPVCPVCNTCYGTVMGNQPPGTMSDTTISTQLPGYHCNTIIINYTFSGGTQAANHPNPGKPYYPTSRQAYLPNNKEGQEILKLLKKAFEQKLIFTVGQSRTSGSNDVITWNDIHHKTNISGGPSGYGYPDPDYLKRVREELKAKGIE
ncbi:E3 ubiquitin-protein ligase DTX3L [Microcaecilia unicolor]|uniref:E3 ubiquitin-protein ligase n=1 Tax=Microcaecilia unicolor TaxID=1415580 RepID=A0A6P7YJ69_9AMPH|nr:E3 ubiquitin-protein ligase DTX3L [Microcaecilia unicolor]